MVLKLTPHTNHCQSMDNVSMIISHTTRLNVQKLKVKGCFAVLKMFVYYITAKTLRIKEERQQ
jgi:hypothetical protein